MRRPLRLSKVWRFQTSLRDATDQESTARSAIGAHSLPSQGGEALTRGVHPALQSLCDDVHSDSVWRLEQGHLAAQQQPLSKHPLTQSLPRSRPARTQSPWGLYLGRSAPCNRHLPHHGRRLTWTRPKALGCLMGGLAARQLTTTTTETTSTFR